jgi:hypothetical protein
MLRRYLITNGIMTALLYGAFQAFVPSTPNLLHSAWSAVDAFAMQSTLLGPFVNHTILVAGGL